VTLAITSRLFFGEPLPGDWLGWLLLLIGIWSGLSVLQATVAAFVDQHKRRPVKLRFSGHLLPAGWIGWGVLLIYEEPRPLPVLVFLSGLLAMLIAARELRRNP
jgi:CHASE2 domain-containing sensor protein